MMSRRDFLLSLDVFALGTTAAKDGPLEKLREKMKERREAL